MTRIVWHALPMVLMLTVAPSVSAQSFDCHPIRRGESALEAARRLTGDSRNTYQTSFQIMNPASRFIPKSQYNRIRPGWRACVIRQAVQRASATPNRAEAREVPDAANAVATSEPALPIAAPDVQPPPAALATAEAIEMVRSQSPASELPGTIRGVDLTMVWLGAALAVPWFGWRFVDDYLARRRTATLVMRHYADRFVAEFQRTLVRHGNESPVRSRLRWSVRRGRFGILLAPGEGRRYPNLSDHKNNVEYDVSRVMHVLADHSFVSGSLYTQAEWVVVPLQFKAGPRQSGVTCISSL